MKTTLSILSSIFTALAILVLMVYLAQCGTAPAPQTVEIQPSSLEINISGGELNDLQWIKVPPPPTVTGPCYAAFLQRFRGHNAIGFTLFHCKEN